MLPLIKENAQKLLLLPQRICEIKMKLENPDLEKIIEENTGLKQLVVNYIGGRLLDPEEIENFLRGYEQALIDVENTKK